MPKYLITAPDGRKFRITGDTPPSEQDLNNIFGQVSGQAPEADPTPEELTANIPADKLAELRARAEEVGGKKFLGMELPQAERVRDFGRAVTQGATFGLGDEAEAVLRGLGGRGYESVKSEIGQEQRKYSQERPVESLLADIGGGIASGGVLAKGLGLTGKGLSLGQKALQGAKIGAGAGAVEGFTRGSGALDRLKGAKTGAIFGGALGGSLPVAGAGLKKAGELFPAGAKRLARTKAGEVLEQSGDLEFKNIATSNKGIKRLKEVAKINDDYAVQVRDKADDALTNSLENRQNIIKKELGFDDIQKAKAEASKGYQNLFTKSAKKKIGQDIYTNDTLKDALATARKQDLTGELANLSDDSLPVAQRTKEILDDMIAGSKSTGDFGKQQPTNLTRQLQTIKDNFVSRVDNSIPEYKSVRSEFGKAKRANDLVDKLLQPSGADKSFDSSLLNAKNKTVVSDVYGKNKADSLWKALNKDKIATKRLASVYNTAENTLTKPEPKQSNLLRESLESAGSIVGRGLDVVTLGKQDRTRKALGDILLQNQKYTPIGQNKLTELLKTPAFIGTVGATQGE